MAMKRKILYGFCAVAFVGILAVVLYNQCKLYRFKGLKLTDIKEVIKMKDEKCAFNQNFNSNFNPNFNEGGGG